MNNGLESEARTYCDSLDTWLSARGAWQSDADWRRWGSAGKVCKVCSDLGYGESATPPQPAKVVFTTTATRGWSRIEISVDGTYEGTLTRTYIDTAHPGCNTEDASRVVVERPPGTYPYRAEADGGSSIWTNDVEFSEGCSWRRLSCGANADCSR